MGIIDRLAGFYFAVILQAAQRCRNCEIHQADE
jgi:hypothetical protein